MAELLQGYDLPEGPSQLGDDDPARTAKAAGGLPGPATSATANRQLSSTDLGGVLPSTTLDRVDSTVPPTIPSTLLRADSTVPPTQLVDADSTLPPTVPPTQLIHADSTTPPAIPSTTLIRGDSTVPPTVPSTAMGVASTGLAMPPSTALGVPSTNLAVPSTTLLRADSTQPPTAAFPLMHTDSNAPPSTDMMAAATTLPEPQADSGAADDILQMPSTQL
eukprot:GFYU01055540.1.p1 GENE.GFYU01055540.1~~GFYU01055540.1.p1  ORF type:complete len:257 (-),score=27.74 GFYU01055540.1:137-796(-)